MKYCILFYFALFLQGIQAIHSYVAGISQGDDITGYDIVVVKYNNAGEEQWAARYNHATTSDYPPDASDYPNDMVLLADGVVVTGKAEDNYLTVKFSLDGQVPEIVT